MIHIVYDEDTGKITQANQSYGPTDGLEDLMRDAGQHFIRGKDTLPSSEHWMVNTQTLELTSRPSMPIIMTKNSIKAGGDDTTVFLGVPKNAKVSVWSSGMHVGTFDIPDGEFEVGIPCPCTYQISFALWPYKSCNFSVEAVA